jgi:hypothetical protein
MCLGPDVRASWSWGNFPTWRALRCCSFPRTTRLELIQSNRIALFARSAWAGVGFANGVVVVESFDAAACCQHRISCGAGCAPRMIMHKFVQIRATATVIRAIPAGDHAPVRISRGTGLGIHNSNNNTFSFYFVPYFLSFQLVNLSVQERIAR